MNKNLTVYPISSGSELNIFANDNFIAVSILDMHGNVIKTYPSKPVSHTKIDISTLTRDTYIIQVHYSQNKVNRSVFVKT